LTLYSGDPKISVLHYRLVWKPNFILPFGPGPDFKLPFPAAAEENLGFIVGIFHFLTEKVNFILLFGLGPDFVLPFGLGPDFILPSQDFLGQVNTVSFARPLIYLFINNNYYYYYYFFFVRLATDCPEFVQALRDAAFKTLNNRSCI
jgi:hypothetical protein